MKISGFTMCRNASKLFYPVKESIMSLLPLVDEFVVALGNSDDDDNTESLIKSIKSDKIRIIYTKWDLNKYPKGMENAHQTDIAKAECKGEWLIYLQADEVIHEKFLPNIKDSCLKHTNNNVVDGFLLKYLHFYGDFDHYNDGRGWYQKEIRIIRNNPDIHSYESAQSFRKIPNFDGLSYRKKEGSKKLNVIEIDAFVYHYGWVRPPEYMQKKKIALDKIHSHNKSESLPALFNYGPIGCLPKFNESHPLVMKEWIQKFNWEDHLDYGDKYNLDRPPMKHEKIKYRALRKIEKAFFNGDHLFPFSNWNIINS